MHDEAGIDSAGEEGAQRHVGHQLVLHRLRQQVGGRMAEDLQAVRVAVGDDGAVFGWICYTPLRSTAVVHYLYVRAPLRRTGIGRRLLEACGVALDRPVPVTQVTDSGTPSSSLIPPCGIPPDDAAFIHVVAARGAARPPRPTARSGRARSAARRSWRRPRSASSAASSPTV